MAVQYKYEEGQIKLHSTEHSCRRCWVLFIISLLLIIGLAAWLFVSGYFVAADSDSPQALSLRGKMNEQAHTLEVQDKKIKDIEKELGVAKREKEIQKTANEELNKKLLLAEKKLSEAEEQLLLYGNILSSKDLEPGLRIQHFKLKKVTVDADGKKLPSSRLYRYYLVLSNIRNDKSVEISGDFDIRFVGKSGGKSETLKHKSLIAKESGTPLTRFELKYYSSVEDVIELPEGFKPEKIVLRVSPKGAKTLEQTHKWKDALNGAK